MKTNDIKWEAPPTESRRGQAGADHWRAIAEALRSRPGEWALVEEDAPSGTSTRIKNGHCSGFEAGEFEAVSRSIAGSSPARYRVYARYVGRAVAS